jgi:hypothetical protein
MRASRYIYIVVCGFAQSNKYDHKTGGVAVIELVLY